MRRWKMPRNSEAHLDVGDARDSGGILFGVLVPSQILSQLGGLADEEHFAELFVEGIGGTGGDGSSCSCPER